MDRIRAYIAEQPAVLLRTLQEVPTRLAEMDLPGGSYRSLCLVGSGTSRNALVAAQDLLGSTSGLPVEVVGPLAFLRSAPQRPLRETLGVFLSQTGSSTTTVDALRLAQERGMPAVALTARSDSPFGRVAQRPVIMPIGEEAVGPKTKGYSASLVTLLSLARALARVASAPAPLVDDASGFAHAFEVRLEAWDAVGAELARRWRGAGHVMMLAGGRHLGTALEATLKIQEMSGVSASAWDTEEGLHGRFHALGPNDVAVFLAASGEDVDLAQAAAEVLVGLGVGALLVEAGGATGAREPFAEHAGVSRLRIPIPAGAGAEMDLVSCVVPFQYAADHMGRDRGVDPDEMRYPRLSSKLGIKLAG